MPIIGIATLSFLIYLLLENYFYSRLLKKIPYRVHVNGIRGKSSVTRYITAVFRAGNYVAYGKTTGTEARIINEAGIDEEVHRIGLPNVSEQINIIKDFINRGANAIILECMAINPLYQEWLQEKAVKSNISIITNVRTDHTDCMGETLESIAKSLANTIPTNGIFITSEDNQNILRIFKNICINKNSKMIVADKHQVSDSDIAKFGYYTHKENVAIALVVAQIIGVSRKLAMQGMHSANPDPGNFRIMPITYCNKQVVWVNLFAINDRESFISVVNDIYSKFPDYAKVVILNQRFDRSSRVKLFTDIVTKEYPVDKIITFGDYENKVNQYSIKNGFKKSNILNLGNSINKNVNNGEELFNKILRTTKKKNILIIGAVNIHTVQADVFLPWINSFDNFNLSSICVKEDRVSTKAKDFFDLILGRSDVQLGRVAYD